MQFQRWCRRALLLFVTAVAACSSLYIPAAPHAQGGFFSDMYQGIKDITELPSEVNELKESYRQTQDKLEEANATLEAYRQQNEALLEQNRELTESVAALTMAQQVRENQSRKLRIMILTGVLLIAGYFVVLRLIRVLLRR
ncbi:hypothetical protein [Paenibacillus brevis]|uniref:Uncharacterized protein n=1 Tax=Paenibacillus brevis TaxID=2841508 RepID=A0ABS6FU33_9BACL|nr:hypothetical protein [Paenibacillus brevis]MBU5673518.1 hypothetical protein [Paenibacillus brevis]